MGTSVKFTINLLLSKSLFLFLLKSCSPRGASKKVVAKEDSMGSWIGRQAFPHILLSEILCCCSVAQSCLTHGLQHARVLCPSPSPRACSNSCPLSQWCHPTISSSVLPFSFCLQSFPASGSFPMSQLFTSGGQNYWSFSISPSNEYSGLISFRIDWFDTLAVQQTFKSLLQHHNSKASILWGSAFFMVQFSYPYMTIGKTVALTI